MKPLQASKPVTGEKLSISEIDNELTKAPTQPINTSQKLRTTQYDKFNGTDELFIAICGVIDATVIATGLLTL